MKATALLISLLLVGLVLARTVQEIFPVIGHASNGQIRERNPLAVVYPPALRAPPFAGIESSLPDLLVSLPIPKAPDTLEIQVVRDLYEALSSADPVRQEHGFDAFLPLLIVLHPKAACYMAETWESGSVRTDFLRHVAIEWTRFDWMSSLLWAADLKDPTERIQTLWEVYNLVAQDDALAAVAIQRYFGMDIANLGSMDTPMQF